jgi:hypothetical protein
MRAKKYACDDKLNNALRTKKTNEKTIARLATEQETIN